MSLPTPATPNATAWKGGGETTGASPTAHVPSGEDKTTVISTDDNLVFRGWDWPHCGHHQPPWRPRSSGAMNSLFRGKRGGGQNHTRHHSNDCTFLGSFASEEHNFARLRRVHVKMWLLVHRNQSKIKRLAFCLPSPHFLLTECKYMQAFTQLKESSEVSK